MAGSIALQTLLRHSVLQLWYFVGVCGQGCEGGGGGGGEWWGCEVRVSEIKL